MNEAEILLTFTQSLHLVALTPCILVIFYMVATTQHPRLIIVPTLFFISLTIGLAAPLTLSFTLTESDWQNLQYIADLLLPTLSFLLILQFFLNRVPPVYYWLILFVPFIIALPALNSIWHQQEACFTINVCVNAISLLRITFVVTGAMVMMLLVAMVSRLSVQLSASPRTRTHQYWLIIALILLNLCLMGLELASAGELVQTQAYLLAKVILKLAFIYLILVSIFNVFSDVFAVDESYKLNYHRRPMTTKEETIATRITQILAEEKPYLSIGFKRKDFARLLEISEHQLSRIVSSHFQKTISDLLNDYRIADAKELLIHSDKPITNIAFDVGFNSITSFNRVFKHYEQCPPSQYREQHRNDSHPS